MHQNLMCIPHKRAPGGILKCLTIINYQDICIIINYQLRRGDGWLAGMKILPEGTRGSLVSNKNLA